MVKIENANFSIPDSWTDPRSVPPGFSPQTPANCASAESSRNQIQTSIVDRVCRVYRRNSRKRSKARFYAPPHAHAPEAASRRGGWPPKARLTSQLSHEEPKTRNPNHVSSTPMPCLNIGSLHNTEETLFDVSLTEGPYPVRGYKRMGNVGPKDQISPDTDPIILDHVANALQFISASQTCSTFQTHDIGETLFDVSLVQIPDLVGGYGRVGNVGPGDQISPGMEALFDILVTESPGPFRCYEKLGIVVGREDQISPVHVENARQHMSVKQNLALTLEAINKRHGDITRNSLLESDCMKTLVLLGVCKVVQDLQKKQLKDIVDVGALDSCYTAVRDAENMKVNVRWLRDRLDEIKDAVELTHEKNRHKGEMERLNSEIRDLEGQMAREVVMIEELDRKIGAQQSRFSKFQHTHLMDGLI